MGRHALTEVRLSSAPSSAATSAHAWLAAVVTDAARAADAPCLLELDGTVLAHAVVDRQLPAAWLDAILTGTTYPIERGGKRLSTEGLLPGGPILRRLLGDPGDVVLTVPVPVPGLPTHWLWLLTKRPGPTLEQVQMLTGRIAAALLPDGAAVADREAIAAALVDDVALPPRLAPESPQVRVLTVIAQGAPQAVCAVLTRAVAGRELPPVRLGERIHLVLRDLPQPLEQAQALIAEARSHLDFPVFAVLSDPVGSDMPLRAAREQAELASDAAFLPGECVLAASLRARTAVAVAARAVAELPSPWADPLTALTECERRGSPPFAGALLAWLDSHGDVAMAAARTGTHHNTLRYRLRRAEQILGVRLDDPDERLELHLRLRQHARGKPSPRQ